MKKTMRSGMTYLIVLALAFPTGCAPVPENKTGSELPSKPQPSITATATEPTVPSDSEPKPVAQDPKESVAVTELFPFNEIYALEPDYKFAGDFVLPESDTRKLPDDKINFPNEEIQNQSINQLPIARNEILARHGYVFKTAALQAYFNSKPWYKADPTYAPESLNSVEKYNRGLLEFCETQYYENWARQELHLAMGDAEFYESNKTWTIDLNGDGTPERISYSTADSPEPSHLTHGILKINDQTLEIDAYYLEYVFDIIDIDSSDSNKEIIITARDEGESIYSIIYGYDGLQFSRLDEGLGSVDPRRNVDGSGKITASIGTNILHQIYYYPTYELTNAHQITEMVQDVYPTDVLLFVKKSFQLFSERDFSKPSLIVPEGSILRIINTDTETWCEAKTTTGIKGWFAADWDTIVYENINADDVLLSEFNGY